MIETARVMGLRTVVSQTAQHQFGYVYSKVCLKKTKNNKYERTYYMDQELRMCRADAACTLTRWQHFAAWNDVMVAILKLWRHIRNPTPSIDAYLLENDPAKFHPAPIRNDGALGSLKRSPQEEEQQQEQK